ncbi:unnamed protein product [Rotaria magnacalcarata]
MKFFLDCKSVFGFFHIDKSSHSSAHATDDVRVNPFHTYHRDFRKQNSRYRQRIQKKPSVVIQRVLSSNLAHDNNIVYSNADANYYTIKDDNMRLLMKDVHHEDDYSNL